MDANTVRFLIDIAPIVLLIVVIIQLAEFRKTWWEQIIVGIKRDNNRFGEIKDRLDED
jgi:hypothetical protein